MLTPAQALLKQSVVLFVWMLWVSNCGAVTATGVAAATVMPSPLSASVALYVRTAPVHPCFNDCAAAPADTWPPAAEAILMLLGQDCVAQFTMFGDMSSNYVVRLTDAAYCAWPGRIDNPIVLEPTLHRGGHVSIVVKRAPSSMFADVFEVVINYN